MYGASPNFVPQPVPSTLPQEVILFSSFTLLCKLDAFIINTQAMFSDTAPPPFEACPLCGRSDLFATQNDLEIHYADCSL